MTEAARLAFIERRDGIAGAIEFCKHTAILYRKAVLHSAKCGYDQPHYASNKEYRRKFIASYCEFKRYIREKENDGYGNR